MNKDMKCFQTKLLNLLRKKLIDLGEWMNTKKPKTVRVNLNKEEIEIIIKKINPLEEPLDILNKIRKKIIIKLKKKLIDLGEWMKYTKEQIKAIEHYIKHNSIEQIKTLKEILNIDIQRKYKNQ